MDGLGFHTLDLEIQFLYHWITSYYYYPSHRHLHF